jgi:S-adenosylmethionine:diacylglycerol 3-amino-3-carboxypropyl transferase
MSAMRAEAVWRRGLFFGRMYEDWAIEDEVLPSGRVLCVASAGDTAFALAGHGRDVTSVDVSAAQVEYVQARIAGAPPRDGRAERVLRVLRAAGAAAGWTRARLRAFCELDDPDAQLHFFTRELDTARFRIALALLFRTPALLPAYGALLRALPPRFDFLLHARLRRGFARHPNRTNPWARSLLLDEQPDVTPLPITVVRAEITSYLARSDAGTFDGFALSNVLDGSGSEEPLLAAVRAAAAPGAVLVLRSFAEPRSRSEAEWAARDRSLLWGAVRVERL